MVDSGARITLGSDFPVETMNPLAGFYAAITRKSPTGDSPHGPNGWCVEIMPLPIPKRLLILNVLNRFPEQRLTREEALRGHFSFPA
jgi:hypothetical protein